MTAHGQSLGPSTAGACCRRRSATRSTPILSFLTTQQNTFSHRLRRVCLLGSSTAGRMECAYVEIAVDRDTPHGGGASFASLAGGADDEWRPQAASRVADR